MKKIFLLFTLLLFVFIAINTDAAKGVKSPVTFKTQKTEENNLQKRKNEFNKEFLVIIHELQKNIDLNYINSPEAYIEEAKNGKFTLKEHCYYLLPKKSVYKVAQVLADEVLYLDSSDKIPPIILDTKLSDRVYIEGQGLQYGAELFQYIGIENYITALGVSQQAFVFHPVANKKIKDLILKYKDVS